jgi:transcriptional regulator with XRE-family HTH domain
VSEPGTARPSPGTAGPTLRVLRLRAGLSSEQLAERIGTNQSRVSRTELAKFRASLDMVRRWLDVTGADEAGWAELLRLAEQSLAGQSLVEMESYRYPPDPVGAGARLERGGATGARSTGAIAGTGVCKIMARKAL